MTPMGGGSSAGDDAKTHRSRSIAKEQLLRDDLTGAHLHGFANATLLMTGRPPRCAVARARATDARVPVWFHRLPRLRMVQARSEVHRLDVWHGALVDRVGASSSRTSRRPRQRAGVARGKRGARP